MSGAVPRDSGQHLILPDVGVITLGVDRNQKDLVEPTQMVIDPVPSALPAAAAAVRCADLVEEVRGTLDSLPWPSTGRELVHDRLHIGPNSAIPPPQAPELSL